MIEISRYDVSELIEAQYQPIYLGCRLYEFFSSGKIFLNFKQDELIAEAEIKLNLRLPVHEARVCPEP